MSEAPPMQRTRRGRVDQPPTGNLFQRAAAALSTRIRTPINQRLQAGIKRRIASVLDLEKIAPERITIWKFGEPEEFTAGPPMFSDAADLPPRVTAMMGTYHSPQAFVAEVRDVGLFTIGHRNSGERYTFSGFDGHLLLESLDKAFIDQFYGRLDIRQCLQAGRLAARGGSPQARYDTIYAAQTIFPSSFFYWLAVIMPGLDAIDHYRSVTGRGVTILVPDGPWRWIDESMPLAGYGPDQVIRSNFTDVHAERLLLRPKSLVSQFASIEGYHWMKQKMLANLPPPDPTADPVSPYIYISRSKAKRKVLNEDEVLNFLSPLGFRAYDLEDRSLAENVRLFSQAKVVVGPHGAGMSHIIFAPETAHLVECFGGRQEHVFHLLANALNLGYTHLMSEFEPNQADLFADMQIDVERLKPLIHHVLDSQK